MQCLSWTKNTDFVRKRQVDNMENSFFKDPIEKQLNKEQLDLAEKLVIPNGQSFWGTGIPKFWKSIFWCGIIFFVFGLVLNYFTGIEAQESFTYGILCGIGFTICFLRFLDFLFYFLIMRGIKRAKSKLNYE